MHIYMHIYIHACTVSGRVVRPGRIRVPCAGLAIQQWDYIIHTYSSFSAQEDACISTSCYVLQCSSTLPEVTLARPKFYAYKMGISASPGWVRGYFIEQLGQPTPDRQFQDFKMHACMYTYMYACMFAYYY